MLLSDVSLDEVFKSTQQNMQQSAAPERVIVLVLCAAALVVILVVLQQRRKRQAIPKPVNHHGKLLKEMLRTAPLRSPQLKLIRQIAAEQECCSPLVPLLCPSLLASGIERRTPEQRKALAQLVKQISQGPLPS